MKVEQTNVGFVFETTEVISMTELDHKGRCCGKKPLKYTGKRFSARQWFCARCNRSFDLDTKKQIANWAWTEKSPGVFEQASLNAQRNGS